uniref:Adenosine kinase n=1 Tax=Parastrongyloides trichosuri TaxID=131310 RepID=A0A0N4ZRK1_PARTI
MAQNIEEGILLGLCNPLLDIQTTVDEAFLKKYKLKSNDAILADESHQELFRELESMENIEYIPGGSAQNSFRVCQWIVKKEKVCTFFGAIGNDKNGETLKEKSILAGVNVKYQVNPSVRTGRCAALITDTHRSLVADLGAANTFTINHLEEDDNAALIEKAKFFYISGFFLTVCPPAIQKVASHAANNNKVLCMNLSAPFICQLFKEPMNAALPYVDILFGNETEAVAYAKANDYKTEDLKEIALKLSEHKKINIERKRLVIITQGHEPVIVCNDGKITEHVVNLLSKEKIIDTNGAGDAFVGGYLSQLIQGKDVEECIKCANFAASTIIQHHGCTFPAKCTYGENDKNGNI